MSLLDIFNKKNKKYEDYKNNKNANKNDEFTTKLIKYLTEDSGLEYPQKILDATVCDVMTLDEDLLAFVKEFIMTSKINPGELSCDKFFTMKEFLDSTGYNPVTAAIYFQMYREDKYKAIRTFLFHDEIIPKDTAEDNKEEA